MAKHRANVKHKAWAHFAVQEQGINIPPELATADTIRLVATFHPKTANKIDKDNASASLKAYQDGIASALGCDDRIFAEPVILFAAPVKGGKVVIEVFS